MQRVQIPLVRLLRQPRQQVFVVVAEGAHLPADVLQVPLVELLLGNDVPLDFHLPGGVEPLGQIEHQPRRQAHRRQNDYVIQGKKLRRNPSVEKVGRLYDADQGVQKQGHSAGLGALHQQKAEPAAEAQAVQQGGAEHHDGTGNG